MRKRAHEEQDTRRRRRELSMCTWPRTYGKALADCAQARVVAEVVKGAVQHVEEEPLDGHRVSVGGRHALGA